jgi:GTPase SAR1 family protein
MSMEADASVRPTSLFDYRRIELNVVSDLQRLRAISQRIGLEPETVELIDTALARNKEQKFSIAVVGEFKRGKSTFINALLGKEILPSDVLPCSATLNRVTYGFEPRVELHFKVNGTGGRVEHIDIGELVDYVTKLTPESKERAANIE